MSEPDDDRDHDHEKTSVYDSATSRGKKSTERGVPPGVRAKSHTAQRREAVARPTVAGRPASKQAAGNDQAPTEVLPRHDRSEPIRVISMKTPSAPAEKLPAQMHVVKLRPLSDATPVPRALGRLAPPRDPKGVRARQLRDYVIWGSAVVILGCSVMLAIWFIARR